MSNYLNALLKRFNAHPTLELYAAMYKGNHAVAIFDVKGDPHAPMILIHTGMVDVKAEYITCEYASDAHDIGNLFIYTHTTPKAEIEALREMRKAIALAQKKGRKFSEIEEHFFDDGYHPTTLMGDPDEYTDDTPMRELGVDNNARVTVKPHMSAGDEYAYEPGEYRDLTATTGDWTENDCGMNPAVAHEIESHLE